MDEGAKNERRVWANQGEAIVCTQGHHICDIAHVIFVEDPRSAGDFTNWMQPQPAIQDKVADIKCKLCRGAWVRGASDGSYSFHFADGWR